MQEVVLLCGPPFSGKTQHYKRFLKSSHERVSASELFRANPGWGLRNIVLWIVEFLERGKKVVIDDENWSRRTRESYIKSIRAKVPACRFVCIVLRPQSAFECFWRREWALAHQFQSHSRDHPQTQWAWSAADLLQSETRIQKWFQHEEKNGEEIFGLESVEAHEGWHQVQDIATSLSPETNYKFEVPALILAWGAVKENLSIDLVQALTVWKSRTVHGRVIVLADLADGGSKRDKNQGDDGTQANDDLELKKLTETTQSLSIKLGIPVYFLLVTDHIVSGSFTRPPKPGVLAFLQHLHNLDLHHPGTVYIHQSGTRNVTALAESGIRQVAIGGICGNPDSLALGGRAQTSGPAHESIQELVYCAAVNPQPASQSHGVPLFEMMVNGSPEERTVVVKQWGRVHGVSYADKDSVQAFQEEYLANASLVTAEGSKMGMKPLCPSRTTQPVRRADKPTPAQRPEALSRGRSGGKDLPSWMKRPIKRKSEDDEEEEEEKEQGRGERHKDFLGRTTPQKAKTSDGDVKRYSSLPHTVYCMTVAELREVATYFIDQIDSDAEDPRNDGIQDHLNQAQHTHPKYKDIDQCQTKIHGTREVRAEGGMSVKAEQTLPSLGAESRGDRREARQDGGHHLNEERSDGKEDKVVGSGNHSDDGVASIITDLFPGESRRKKPPPKKKTARSAYGAPPSSAMWSDEELSWQPDAALSIPVRSYKSGREETRDKKPAQDLSFLDEIF